MRPGAELGGCFLREEEALIVIVVTMIMRQTTVARDYVEDDFAAFKIESEFKLSQSSGAQDFAQASLVSFAVQHKEAAATSA